MLNRYLLCQFIHNSKTYMYKIPFKSTLIHNIKAVVHGKCINPFLNNSLKIIYLKALGI